MIEFSKSYGFRGLFETLKWSYHDTESIYNEILQAYLTRCKEWLHPIQPFGKITYRNKKDYIIENGQRSEDDHFLDSIWHLYALSRVNDFLLLPFQPEPTDIAKNKVWHYSPNHLDIQAIKLTHEEYIAFLTEIGFTQANVDNFHPFYHEIVSVEQAEDDDTPISIVEELWPCFMFGSMMFSRAGVKVRGGKNHIVKNIAENSTLHWTYWRRYCPTDDLSMGWGSNSQWRTYFRRDYVDDKAYYYNVDEEFDAEKEYPKLIGPRKHIVSHLTAQEKVELLRYRCYIKTSKPDDDLYPYPFSYTEPK